MTPTAILLDKARKELLDLSNRNRLLNTPFNSKTAKIVEVADELSSEVFRLLVKEEKTLSFLPGIERKKNAIDTDAVDIEDETDIGELPQPEDDEEVNEKGVAKRHSDHKLQTLLTSEGLQKRLLTLYYDALTFEEEQGVNILYLALGMLKWYEADTSDTPRYAPLLLVPITLSRGSASEKFKIKWRNEDPAVNLTLQAKMKAEFGLVIPDLPENDDWDIAVYMKNVADSVSSKPKFVVEENKIVLGFFSFAKFLMYRDLDTNNWPKENGIDAKHLIKGLMQDGFPKAENMVHEDANIDEHIPLVQRFHVIDADSSQSLAIEEVRRGRNMVIQGPPGTGKSQTITNIIASAVSDGKKVLFVAEKMAALEVVQRRMENIGLGPICLELHSSKSNKRSVLEELKKTRDLGKPKAHDSLGVTERLNKQQDKLNAHVATLHVVNPPSNLTAHQVIGNLVKLKQSNIDARNITLTNAQIWTPQDKKDREDILLDVCTRIQEIGTPNKHVWRGINCDNLLPNEIDKIEETVAELVLQLEIIFNETSTVESAFQLTNPVLDNIEKILEASRCLSQAPVLDFRALSSDVWKFNKSMLIDILKKGQDFYEIKTRLADKVSDIALTTSLDECRKNIAMYGESFFSRLFNSQYKSSIRLLKSIVKTSVPDNHSDILNLLDQIIAVQKLEQFIVTSRETGEKAFGSSWHGVDSDWQNLLKAYQWYSDLDFEKLPTDFISNTASTPVNTNWLELYKSLNNKFPNTYTVLVALFDKLKIDVNVAFAASSLQFVRKDDLVNRLNEWKLSFEKLTKWVNFRMKYDQLNTMGLSSISSKLWDGTVGVDNALNIFQRAYFDQLAEVVFTKYPNLRNFDGDEHSAQVKMFQADDKYRIEQARVELRGKHHSTIPSNDGGIGPLGILNGEFVKKRNHLPLRQLLKKAGPVIQTLKPVFMMSPLSIAQFLEPGALDFDLLVIDEASQVEPVDALGAIARAKQVVVVGDTRQLPPTRFFSKVTGNSTDEESEDMPATATQDVESVLGLCLAKGLPQRMLRWHYRSKHQSLIAVSNKQFYEDKLFIVPSPYDAASGMGLKFNYLENGVYDSGGTAANQIEAKAVAKAAIKHALESPNLSLGIGTFSMKQRQAILDELEVLRRMHPDSEAFFAGNNQGEPFFVKNLENIQGDERDVIFISVCYGKNKHGMMNMRFGPLSNEGGERRLNVLISRAKRRCEVFSSIRGNDIDTERAKGAGVASLKLFLNFAETGKLDYNKITSREADSIFEEQVAAALREKGYDVKNQIGIAGFFIDLAVTDPEQTGRFLLGIECDGANYHSSRSCRDRDRLRQNVLEGHGWKIHRVWSTDWFKRPNEQVDKIILAIEDAKKNAKAEDEEFSANSKHNTVFEIASSNDTLTIRIGNKDLSVLYEEALFSVPLSIDPHEINDHEMSKIVTKIVEVESPINESEIVARVRNLWNLARAGSRIQAKVKSGLNLAVSNNLITTDRTFFVHANSILKVRNRANVNSSSLKKVENLPPQEIHKAVLAIIEANFGADKEQISSEVGRLLGFKSTSSQLRELIDGEVQLLINTSILTDNNGLLKLNKTLVN